MIKSLFSRFGFFLSVIGVVACANNNNNTIKTNSSDEQVAAGKKELSAQDIYRNSTDKVALVICYKDNIPYSQGTAFFIGPTTAVTNYHVIADGNAIGLKFSNKEEVVRSARVVKAAEQYDLAIIETQSNYPYFSLTSTSTDGVGAKVYTIGNPRGLEGTISDGIISGLRNSDGIEYIQITAPISPGNSGGPLLNEQGKVIGVSSFTFKDSQNLNFAIPIKYISKCTDYVYRPRGREVKKNTNSDAVTMTNFKKDQITTEYSFSIRNNTSDYIKNIYGVFIYRDSKGEVLHYATGTLRDEIAPGLAKRFAFRNAFPDSEDYVCNGKNYYGGIRFTAEYRLLSYEICD